MYFEASRLRRYASLGSLLLDVRTARKHTQQQMADELGVPPKTYGRWERNESRASPGHLERLSSILRLPFEVVLRLNHGFPTLYHTGSHRFQTCTFDRDFVNQKVLREQLFDGSEEGRIEPVGHGDNLGLILADRRLVFPRRLFVAQSVLSRAIDLLPELNFIVRDPKGHYAGHILSIPLAKPSVDALLAQRIQESDIKLDDLFPGSDPLPAVHFYSLFATCSTYAYTLIRRLVTVLVRDSRFKDESIVSTYVTTLDGWEWASKTFGEPPRFIDEDPGRVRHTETPPRLYASTLKELTWIEGYRHQVERPR